MKKILLFHLCPINNYKWNLELLKPRLHLFDKVIIAVAQGPEMEDFYHVNKVLPKHAEVEIIQVANDPKLGETTSFPTLLKRAKELISDESLITLYAHAKGVSYKATDQRYAAIQLWTESLHKLLFDQTKKIEALFKHYPVVGAFKRYGYFPSMPSGCDWHYTGSFFWFNNAELFKRDWEDIPLHKHAVEGYPSRIFSSQEAGCIFGNGIGNLYNIKYLKEVLAREE